MSSHYPPYDESDSLLFSLGNDNGQGRRRGGDKNAVDTPNADHQRQQPQEHPHNSQPFQHPPQTTDTNFDDIDFRWFADVRPEAQQETRLPTTAPVPYSTVPPATTTPLLPLQQEHTHTSLDPPRIVSPPPPLPSQKQQQPMQLLTQHQIPRSVPAQYGRMPVPHVFVKEDSQEFVREEYPELRSGSVGSAVNSAASSVNQDMADLTTSVDSLSSGSDPAAPGGRPRSVSSVSLTHSVSSSSVISNTNVPAILGSSTKIVKPKRSGNSVASKRDPKRDKNTHNIIERKYRTNITARIMELRNAVPTLRAVESPVPGPINYNQLEGLAPASKLNKANILSKATEYIRHLESKNQALLQEINMLRAVIDRNNIQLPQELHAFSEQRKNTKLQQFINLVSDNERTTLSPRHPLVFQQPQVASPTGSSPQSPSQPSPRSPFPQYHQTKFQEDPRRSS